MLDTSSYLFLTVQYSTVRVHTTVHMAHMGNAGKVIDDVIGRERGMMIPYDVCMLGIMINLMSIDCTVILIYCKVQCCKG